MTCGIYLIKNNISKKEYIGQSINIEKRWKDHKKDLRNNIHKNQHLQNAYNKYKYLKSTNIKKLKNKVIKKGLPWIKLQKTS